MNRIEKFFGLRNEAKIRYLDGEFEVMSPGDFVRCAVTGQPITLPDLRYWSVDAQEAYASADIPHSGTLNSKPKRSSTRTAGDRQRSDE